MINTYDNMTWVPVSDVVSEIMMACTDMPQEMAESLVSDTVIDFLKRTSLLKFWVPVDLQDCVEDYFLDVPECLELNYVHRICPDTACACGGPGATLVRNAPCAFVCGARQVRFVPPGTIQISPTPKADEAQAFWVEVSATPKRDSCELPDFLYERYREEISNGAMWRAVRIPNVKWHDRLSAKEYRDLYNMGVATAGTERLLNRTTGLIRLQPKGAFV
jgi:hypothetical protein